MMMKIIRMKMMMEMIKTDNGDINSDAAADKEGEVEEEEEDGP